MRRPALTSAEKEQIRYLRGERGWSHSRIALQLGRAVGSVSWFCLQEGIEKPDAAPMKVSSSRSICQRGNHIVRRFNAREDRAIIALRLAGKTPTEIGRKLGRRSNSITGRLMTLARHDAQGTQ
jgi:hypothetical protein